MKKKIYKAMEGTGAVLAVLGVLGTAGSIETDGNVLLAIAIALAGVGLIFMSGKGIALEERREFTRMKTHDASYPTFLERGRI